MMGLLCLWLCIAASNGISTMPTVGPTPLPSPMPSPMPTHLFQPTSLPTATPVPSYLPTASFPPTVKWMPKEDMSDPVTCKGSNYETSPTQSPVSGCSYDMDDYTPRDNDGDDLDYVLQKDGDINTDFNPYGAVGFAGWPDVGITYGGGDGGTEYDVYEFEDLVTRLRQSGAAIIHARAAASLRQHARRGYAQLDDSTRPHIVRSVLRVFFIFSFSTLRHNFANTPPSR